MYRRQFHRFIPERFVSNFVALLLDEREVLKIYETNKIPLVIFVCIISPVE